MTFRSILTVLLIFASSVSAERAIWVSPEGNDDAAGTREAPLRTPEIALRHVRELRRLEDPSIAGGIHIVFMDGTYELDQTLRLRVEDSATADSPTVFKAAPGAKPVFSGGMTLTGWKTLGFRSGVGWSERLKEVWTVDSPELAGRPLEFRDVWINGARADRASNWSETDPYRILEWDKTTRSCWVPAAAVEGCDREGNGLEMVIHQMWAIAILRVSAIEIVGDRARVSFLEPEGQIQWEHPWPPVVINELGGNSAFFLANDLAFLDAPGEWIHLPGEALYYVPREGDRLTAMNAVVPRLKHLVRIEGTVERPVEHIHFEGIHFMHTAWRRPSEEGHVPLQAGFAMTEAYKLRPAGTPEKASLENQAWVKRPPAAVMLRHVRETRFHRCVFQHLGASGLDYLEGAVGDRVEGNVFRDIGGNGFVAGAFQDGPIETHVPYAPADERLLVQNLVFRNNLITDVAAVDWGCVGVAAGYVRETEIAHNEISNVAYTGISLGWGWIPTVSVMRDNRVVANHIHHYGRHMYDTGGIYTLSAQPGTLIARNAIHSINEPAYVHDPHHWSFIYLDEGSAGITVRNNWTDRIKFSTNANGPDNVWAGNGPDADPAVRKEAGLQPAYRDLLSFGRNNTLAPGP